MTADANANRAQPAIAPGQALEVVERDARIVVIGRQVFFDFVAVAFVSAFRRVSQGSARRFEFMKYFRDQNDVAGEQARRAQYRASHLENFREHYEPGIRTGGGGPHAVRPHDAGGRCEIDMVFGECHVSFLNEKHPRYGARAKTRQSAPEPTSS